jgi:D-alanyl-D-alanine carboxypeptidase
MSRRTRAALTASTVTALWLTLMTGPAHAEPLPPLDPDALGASVAGLPDEAVTGAQVRVNGSGGAWSGRRGVRDVRSGAPVPDDARFRVGSATKMFTAALVLQLAEEGRLGLDDPVQGWLPGVLPPSDPSVTIRQLLDHTSGLPMSTEDEGHEDPAWVVRHRFDWHTPRAVVRSAVRQPPAFPPGTLQQYNGVNYFLAGMVVERATGHTFARALETRLLQPLGLADTYLPRRGDVRLHGKHTHGYLRVDGRLVDVTAQSAYAWAEGGLVSTTHDLGRFLRRLLAGRVVPQPWLDRMLRVPDVPYAGGGPARFSLGLERTVLPGGLVVYGKSGSVPGFRTLAVSTTDLARTLVLSLTTGTGGGGDDRMLRIALATFGPNG